MSIWLADVNGKVVKAIVQRDVNKFAYRVSFNVITLIDFEPYAVLDSFECRQLRLGLLLKAAVGGFPRENHHLFPRVIPSQDVLLQNLQSRQPHK